MNILKFCRLLVIQLTMMVCATASEQQDDHVEITEGSGSFFISAESTESMVEVFYHRARNWTGQSPIVIVMPGGGRNGDDYRDAWIKSAEQYGLLVLAPSFSEKSYPGPINYNLARMISDDADRRTLSEIKIRGRQSQWLFSDIEQIFRVASTATGSTVSTYDIFGHSAGGQIVHRLVLFQHEGRFRNAVAANSGWYTTVSEEVGFPFGLKSSPISDAQLVRAMSRKLTILLGEKDDENETRGHLRRTPETDAQGAHRLERGQHFFSEGQHRARQMKIPFSWQIQIVPNVGHSFRQMSEAAADYLYGR